MKIEFDKQDLINFNKKIKEVGEIGTQNILDIIKNDCKIV